MEEKNQMFRNRLTKVYRHLSRIARRQGVSCYRVYDHDLPEFPFCIELYGDRLYVAEYDRRHGLTEEEHQLWFEASLAIMADVMEVDPERIYSKLRRRKQGRLGQYQKLQEEKEEFEVEESGLKFLVNLTDYLDTGLFLDHRLTRARVREEASGKRVLNLFAYTGSFSVYAAAGGASRVVTADLSNTYLNWAGRNLTLNGFADREKYSLVQADVLALLTQLDAGSFDLIIMDPPTFSNSKKMEGFLDIQRDHVQLINQCLQLLDQGGVLYFSTNARKFQLQESAIRSTGIRDITRATTPFDFEGRLFRWCFRIGKEDKV